MDSAVILLSGGMDSGVLLAWASRRYQRIEALSFDYGSKHSDCEKNMARLLANEYGVPLKEIELPFIGDLFKSSLLKSGSAIPDGPYAEDNMSSTVVPFRNGIMLSVAAGYAESNGIAEILIAAHGGDHPVYPDCRNEFITAISRACELGTVNGITISAPFGEMQKSDIARIGRGLDFDFTKTWSCYRGGQTHCGACATCLERKQALGFDQGLDPTEYLR